MSQAVRLSIVCTIRKPYSILLAENAIRFVISIPTAFIKYLSTIFRCIFILLLHIQPTSSISTILRLQDSSTTEASSLLSSLKSFFYQSYVFLHVFLVFSLVEDNVIEHRSIDDTNANESRDDMLTIGELAKRINLGGQSATK